MKKCPLDVFGLKDKFRWYFGGYPHHFLVSDEDIEDSNFYDIIENIVSSLRDRKYEYLVIEKEFKAFLNFVQTAVYGKKYRLECSVSDFDGHSHVYMVDELTAKECADSMYKILVCNELCDLPWKEITQQVIKQ